MPVSLYQATIPTYIQVCGAVRGLLDKADAHCSANDLAPESLIEARLIEDMWTFAFQIRSVAKHSFGAIEGLRAGLFTPPNMTLSTTFAELKQELDDALQGLRAVTEEEVEGFIGKPMRFEAGKLQMNFDPVDFLFSFSQPNFNFHAATAYGILRARGLPLGKLDYLAGLRAKPG